MDVVISGKTKKMDTDVHTKFERLACECKNDIMGFYNDVMDEKPPGSGNRCIPTGKTVEVILV